MLSPSNSKLCRMGQTPSLIQKMSDKISSSLLRSSISPSDFFEYLSKNDIQIYWPYSEDWDGETLPVITFNPENGNEDWNYGYKQVKEADGTISIDTVIVDESICYGKSSMGYKTGMKQDMKIYLILKMVYMKK